MPKQTPPSDPIPDAPIPAVGIICLRGDDVLMIKRGKPPKQGEWSIPGGRIEAGESFEDAALRELMEETGITAKICGKVAQIDADFGTHHYMLHDYAAIWVSGAPRAGDDAAYAAFLSPSELERIELWSKTREVIEQSRALIKGQHTLQNRVQNTGDE